MDVAALSLSQPFPWASRPVALVMAGVVVIALAGCGPDDDRPGDASTSANAPAATMSAPAPSTQAAAAASSAPPESPVPSAGAGSSPGTIDTRIAFLIGMLDDPASASDAELEEQFAPSFLAAVPPAAIRQATVEATANGRAPWVERDRRQVPDGATVTVVSADGVELTLVVQLDTSGDRRIVGAQVVPGSLAAVEAAFAEPGEIDGSDGIDAALDGVASRVAYSVFDAGAGRCTSLLSRAGDAVLPTGSAFKLWVLATLARAVRDGDARWDETVDVRSDLRSSPDGEIYPLADGTPVTLQRLAELMISISDNTATDHLIARLGRSGIEATMHDLGVSTAARNTPFLSTAELFKLKFVDPSLGDRYVAIADPEQRRAFLDGDVAATPLPWVADPTWTGDPALIATPRRIDEIEWFATPQDMCVTFQELDTLAGLPGLAPVAAILERNPGLPFPADQWATVRFKGGSEPGVVMFAYWLVAPEGERRVVVIGISDDAVAFPETDATVPVARLLGLVAQQL